MIARKEKNPLPYIIAIACFLVLFILMKAQDVRTEEARLNKAPDQKRQTASATPAGEVKSKKAKN